ncbi:hypothetical protein FRC10_009525 [Ceratobasidium sp. 414]|nr:hypothetical protein FRC10_009525 [Ceratobasidium sp. 414]
MDEFVDQLLTEERVCDTILPRLTKREVLEETEGLAPRPSALLDAMAGNASGSEDEGGEKKVRKRSQSVKSERSRSRGRSLSRAGSGSPVSLSFPFPLWLSSSSPLTNPLAISVPVPFKKHIPRQDGD